ncbi:MAG: ferrous iron transport protein A [Treponema sp.]|nr:ferrous iron transport protein A [Treponema sp.]
MPLLFAKLGEEVTISSVSGNCQIKQHLNELGFNVGSAVTVVQKIRTGLIVKVKEARVAIDSGMASKILI